jgi:hypothetical protein
MPEYALVEDGETKVIRKPRTGRMANWRNTST